MFELKMLVYIQNSWEWVVDDLSTDVSAHKIFWKPCCLESRPFLMNKFFKERACLPLASQQLASHMMAVVNQWEKVCMIIAVSNNYEVISSLSHLTITLLWAWLHVWSVTYSLYADIAPCMWNLPWKVSKIVFNSWLKLQLLPPLNQQIPVE